MVHFNPEGIEAISPGLRGTSYPGEKEQYIPTLKGLNPSLVSACDATLSGLRQVNMATQGWPSRNRANPGLNDPIPSGLIKP